MGRRAGSGLDATTSPQRHSSPRTAKKEAQENPAVEQRYQGSPIILNRTYT